MKSSMILICFFSFGLLSEEASLFIAVFFLPAWPVSLSFLAEVVLPVDFPDVPEVRLPREVLFLAAEADLVDDLAAEALDFVEAVCFAAAVLLAEAVDFVAPAVLVFFAAEDLEAVLFRVGAGFPAAAFLVEVAAGFLAVVDFGAVEVLLVAAVF